jgi:hypothetical protein
MTLLIPVILCGGSGTRLWPLSRESEPKQFLRLTGGPLSLLQDTALRLKGLDQLVNNATLAPAPILVTHNDTRFLVAGQLQEAGIPTGHIVLEPSGRNTAPALTLAALQALGSHQNVLTTRLVEGLALSAERTVILPLNAFPGGVHYHHDHAYMRRLERKQEHPYVFHMCWTQGKPDKLVYLRKAHMWYLKDACSPLEYLKPDGHVFGLVLEREEGGHDGAQRWDLLSRTCCQVQDSKSP